jgi:uncharacterized protein YecT (DUF1311 family)
MKRCIFIAIFAFSSAAYAQDGKVPTIRYSKSYQSCSDNAGGSYTLIIGCEIQEQILQEERLNRAYVKAMQRSSKEKKRNLRDLERQWIEERNGKCSDPSKQMGLSERVDSMQCRLEKTISRVNWLEDY